MTSVLPEEESNVTRLKLKSQSHATRSSSKQRNLSHQQQHQQDESRSFLTFSRENLSISTSDLEQGFSKASRARCCTRHQTLLSCAALILALSCAGLELWKLRRVLENARDIESLKRDVETLKHRFLEKDLLDELRAFEEQLYGEGASDEEDLSSNPGSNNSDYDSSYDDSSGTSSTSSSDYPTVTLAPNNHQQSLSTISIPKLASTSSATPCTSKDLEEVLAVLRRAEAERGQAFEQSVRERERLLEAERDREQRRGVSEHRIQKGDDKPTAPGRKRKREVVSARDTFFTRLKHPSEG